MIEIKNLTKIYNTRKGIEVKALNEVNLQFENKGMVFILGKSGSGKSTLLNIIGGLDTFDEGEIVIKGKSIKDFSQRDFDSYRNTYIGFIFQEYNVFNELTLEKNISIALELQGLKSDYNSIEYILKQVDLEGYSSRMPYELSTGQKQRIAIARALIKSPDIVLADEPTGALDSTTGKQILEILKKLSKEKLVIVVTHDQEFAEMYADRIVEISDGRIINDTKPPVNLKLYLPDDFKLTNTKLPIKDTFKMGVSNLKFKPIRLIFAILLSAIAFTIFGLVDTVASYNRISTTLISFKESDINYITYKKEKLITDSNGNHFYYDMKMKENDIDLLQKEIPNYEFVPIYDMYSSSIEGSLYSNTFEGAAFYKKDISGSAEITEKLIRDLNIKMEVGVLPTKDDEIVTTKYIYSHFIKYGYKSLDGSKVDISTPLDLIGQTIQLDDNIFTITGIIDTNFNEERYKPLINTYRTDLEIDMLKKELRASLDFGIHSLIFFREGYFYDLNNNPTHEGTFEINEFGVQLFFEENANGQSEYFSKISKLKDKSIIHWKDGIEQAELAENEIIIPISSIPKYSIIDSLSSYSFSDLIGNKTKDLLNDFTTNHYNEIKDKFDTYSGRETTVDDYADYIKNNETNHFHENMNLKYFNDCATIEVIDDIYFPAFQNLKLKRVYEGQTLNYNINVVGVYEGSMDNPLIVSSELFDNLLDTKDGDYSLVLTSLKHNSNDIKLIKFNNGSMDGVEYNIYNEVTTTLNKVNEILEEVTNKIFYFGLGIAFFASLLLYNFISVSISAKKREIGILRAIGARSKDVFMIFLWQSISIALISFVIASICTYIISIYINNIIRIDYQLIISLLTFSIKQVILILFISIFVAYISSFIPVYTLISKKPTEIIRNNMH